MNKDSKNATRQRDKRRLVLEPSTSTAGSNTSTNAISIDYISHKKHKSMHINIPEASACPSDQSHDLSRYLKTLDDNFFKPNELIQDTGLETAAQVVLEAIHAAAYEQGDGGLGEGMASPNIAKVETDGNSNAVFTALQAATTRLLEVGFWTFPLLLSYNIQLHKLCFTHLVDQFPTTAKSYTSPNSIFHKLLDILNAFYICFPPTEDDADDPEVAHFSFTLLKTQPALVALSQLEFPLITSPTISSTGRVGKRRISVDQEVEIDPFFIKKHQKKRSRAASQSLGVDKTAFSSIGTICPRNEAELKQLESDILNERKDILKAYLEKLLRPSSLRHAQRLIARAASEESDPISKQEDSIAHKRRNTSADESSKRTAIDTEAMSVASQALNPVKSIQIMEEDIKDFGVWRILLSGESVRHLRQFSRADRHMFEIIRKKLRELSEGFFSRSNQKRLEGKDSEVPVYEAKMTGDTRLVYTIDCVPDASGERVTQVIKMFGVYTHAQINSRLWAAVASWSTRRGAEYRRRCLFRETSKQNRDYVIPYSWPPLPESYEAASPAIQADADIMLQLHALLTHEKFVPFTQTVLESILADDESTHPFAVSHREQEIIYHPSSCFVIGRSGTGKTTTMLFKMLAIERTSKQLNTRKVRQVFVTQSRVLADRVEEYFVSLMETCAKDVGDSGILGDTSLRKKGAEKRLVELDEEDDQFETLPKKFSELEDRHFPLFLTFDKLCSLLEADMNVIHDTEKAQVSKRFRLADAPDVILDLGTAETITEGSTRRSTRRKRILYEDFVSKYWPHFPQKARKGLDPSLVWNEIQGVICGSENSIEQPGGALSRGIYDSDAISYRKQATFARHRSRLYDLFEIYCKKKRKLGEHDAADRTHALLKNLSNLQSSGYFDYIYVDEIQDNLLIDAKLLRTSCRNPHGIFLAGDTAQQITSTAFRFSDLKAFLYRIEEEDPAVLSRKREAIHPKEFTLAINYRSHGGIINCAHSVVQLLTKLWPDSIDVLEREQGLVDGPKPMFFSGWDVESVHYEQFLFGEVSNRNEFGAQQCILVRNEMAKEQLRSHIGDVGVIMTLYESKGLEFSDVLLYNFFQDSLVSTEWRVILNEVEDRKRAGFSVPTFDELRHLGVCSELKFLYVGLTRARNHLWIWDNSEQANAMKLFWEPKGLIDIKRPGDDIPRLAVSSTPEEWYKMGRILFSRKNFQQAVVCFDRASDPLLSAISQAFHLRKLARVIEAGTDARKRSFLKAAKIFEECAQGSHDQSRVCWVRCAECYVEAGDDRKASDAYCAAEEFTKGAQYARKAAAFDRAVEIIQTSQVDEHVAASIRAVCQVVYLREKAYSKARRLFDSDEDFLERFDLFGFDKSPVLLKLGRFEEVAEIQLKSGNWLEAIDLYIRTASPAAIAKTEGLILDQWWKMLPFGTTADIQNMPTIDRLLSFTEKILSPSPTWLAEVNMFRGIIDNDRENLILQAGAFLKSNNTLAAIRCYGHVYRDQDDISNVSIDGMRVILQHLHHFGCCMRSILRVDNLAFIHDVRTQRLMGYTIDASGTEATIFPASILNCHVAVETTRQTFQALRQDTTGAFVVTIERVGELARMHLVDAFRSIIKRHSHAAAKAVVFANICMAHLGGNCQSNPCTRLHIPTDNGKSVINRRLRLYLRQIIVINDMDFLLRKSERQRLRTFWISKLFGCVYPDIVAAGRIADFVTHLTQTEPLVSQGLTVLRHWIEEGFYNLEPDRMDHILELFLIATAFDHYAAPRYILHSRLERRLLSDGYRVHSDTGQRTPLILDLFNCLFVDEQGTAEIGVAFIITILANRTRVDVHSLVCVLELVTAVVLAGMNPSLHAVVIPKSWLFVLGQRGTWPVVTIWAYISHLVKPLVNLAIEISKGANNLELRRRPLGSHGLTPRISLIERIFRCLILAGHNSHKEVVCNLIGSNIASLSRYTGTADHDVALPWKYIQASGWEDLFRVMVDSKMNTGSDSLVQLVSKHQTAHVIGGVSNLPFEDTKSLFYTFAASPLIEVAQHSTLRANAVEFHPRILPASDSAQQQDTVSSTAADTSNAMSGPTLTIDEAKLSQSFNQDHQVAATRIQKLYRQYRQHVLAATKATALDTWFAQYEKVAHSSTVRYRVRLCGPLPHFMVCVEAYKRQLDRQKRQLSERAQQVKHDELEDTMERITRLSGERKAINTLADRLKPSSKMHQEGNVDVLVSVVEELSRHLKQFIDERPTLEEDWERALKGIVWPAKERAPPKATPKPELNTSDLLEF